MTQKDPSMETISLREFFERVLAERDRRYDERFEAEQRATRLALEAAREALSTALVGTKEATAAALDANRALAVKAEQYADQKLEAHNTIKPWVEAITDALSDRINGLERLQGSRLDVLDRRVSRFENREEGMTITTKFILGGIGLLVSLVGIWLAFAN